MRRQGWWTRHALWRQIVLAVAVALGAVALAIDHNNIRPSWKWIHKDRTLFWITVSVAVLVLVNTVGDLVAQRRALAGEGRRLDIHQAVIGALVAVSQETGLLITELGANVFIAKKWFGYKSWTWFGRTFHLGRRPRLERIERIRLSDYPARSNVPWTQGKGVIGVCWEHGRPEYVDWAPIARRWQGKDISEAQWARISDKDKAGFSRTEFMEMVAKYAEILSVPIRNNSGNVMGVIAVDRVWRSSAPVGQLLKTESVEETVTSAASVLQSVLARR